MEQKMTISGIEGVEKMLGCELVTEYVQTVMLTGRVLGEAPVSTFLIAKPEHGKTSICLETPFACAVDVTDCTGRGLQEILKYKAELTHIIINDLTVVSAHSRPVRAYLIAMINAMTEEGIRSIAFPGQVEHYQNGKRGIVACSTPALMRDSRTWFNKIGLTTRIMPFHYTYSEELVVKIKVCISGEVEFPAPDSLIIPKEVVKINIEEKFGKQIMEISEQKSVELGDDTGIRRLKQFRRLAKAHVLLRGPNDGKEWKTGEVEEQDITFLKRIFPYIDYRQGCVL
jgi:hypothetical protein